MKQCSDFDNRLRTFEMLEMDKFGHGLSSYYIGNIGHKLLRWSGVDEKKAVWYGGMLGFVYLLNVEILDGFFVLNENTTIFYIKNLEKMASFLTDYVKNSTGYSLSTKQFDTLKEIGEKAELELILTSYTARHTWANVMKLLGKSTSLISDALDISKISSGKMSIEKVEFSVLDELSDTAKLFFNSARKKEITLNSFYDPDLPQMIHSDFHRIKQIMNNLLNKRHLKRKWV